ncbi:hypothetical protein CYLTODRAFT_421769 [Cylindrobasidium torrendii FP15055 ss-10]|uniref:Uncharacterized protein n=1 Tax=Cylindrobasidium torrendii FP15055 ss-10 TaxID=1314674 RepID=A0A0D7BCP8_9AGAR|nr:hypothetical protein CYLTODRAFT_421769 [Cylindrobasidium torrendii FP15055 ss-10]
MCDIHIGSFPDARFPFRRSETREDVYKEEDHASTVQTSTLLLFHLFLHLDLLYMQSTRLEEWYPRELDEPNTSSNHLKISSARRPWDRYTSTNNRNSIRPTSRRVVSEDDASEYALLSAEPAPSRSRPLSMAMSPTAAREVARRGTSEPRSSSMLPSAAVGPSSPPPPPSTVKWTAEAASEPRLCLASSSANSQLSSGPTEQHVNNNTNALKRASTVPIPRRELPLPFVAPPPPPPLQLASSSAMSLPPVAPLNLRKCAARRPLPNIPGLCIDSSEANATSSTRTHSRTNSMVGEPWKGKNKGSPPLPPIPATADNYIQAGSSWKPSRPLPMCPSNFMGVAAH